jgi:hypothetical protein
MPSDRKSKWHANGHQRQTTIAGRTLNSDGKAQVIPARSLCRFRARLKRPSEKWSDPSPRSLQLLLRPKVTPALLRVRELACRAAATGQVRGPSVTNAKHIRKMLHAINCFGVSDHTCDLAPRVTCPVSRSRVLIANSHGRERPNVLQGATLPQLPPQSVAAVLKRRSGSCARKGAELTPGDLPCVASAIEAAARWSARLE